MANKSRFRFALCATLLGLSVIAAPLASPQRAWAQERSSRDGEGRGNWRERFRDRGGDRGGDRGRDFGGRGRDNEGRGEDRKSELGSSGSKSGTNGGSSSSSSTESKASGGTSASLSTATWAKQFVKEQDKNGNGWLDGDEKKSLSSQYAGADANKDGSVTVEELIAQSSAPAASAETTTSSSSGGSAMNGTSSNNQKDKDHSKGESEKMSRIRYGSAGGATTASKEGDKRRSYRFTPATQKLPSGLPDWFTSKDSNRDGQVSMSEYSRSWSERSVADFQEIDLNNDGVITPKEASKSKSGG